MGKLHATVLMVEMLQLLPGLVNIRIEKTSTWQSRITMTPGPVLTSSWSEMCSHGTPIVSADSATTDNPDERTAKALDVGVRETSQECRSAGALFPSANTVGSHRGASRRR